MRKPVYLKLFVALLIGGCSNTITGDVELPSNKQSENTLQRSNAQQSNNDTKPGQNESVFSPPKQEEITDEMTKKEILTKLLNTVDYFETAIGKFELLKNEKKSLVEYQLSLTEMEGGYSSVTNYDSNSKSSRVSITYYKDGKLWIPDKSPRSYKIHSGSTLIPEDAFSTNSHGDNVTTYRERPPIGIAQSSLFPYEIASNYTRDNNQWEIEKQNEMLLNHNTIVLKGNLKSSNNQGAKTFRFWVDKDSGILVKYELYDATGNVVSYLHPLELKVNVPVDTKGFEPDNQKKN